MPGRAGATGVGGTFVPGENGGLDIFGTSLDGAGRNGGTPQPAVRRKRSGALIGLIKIRTSFNLGFLRPGWEASRKRYIQRGGSSFVGLAALEQSIPTSSEKFGFAYHSMGAATTLRTG